MAGGAGFGLLVVALALAAVGFGASGIALAMRKDTRARCRDAIGLAIIALVVGGLLPALGTIEGLRHREASVLLIVSGCWLGTNSVVGLLALAVSIRRLKRVSA